MADYEDLIKRLRDACTGHPHAKIPWPHRLLHEAAAALAEARAEVERLTKEYANVNNEFGCQTASWPDASKRVAGIKKNARDAYCRATTAEDERDKLRQERDGLAAAWEAARKTLPPDVNLNAPWSQAIAIMDEALEPRALKQENENGSR